MKTSIPVLALCALCLASCGCSGAGKSATSPSVGGSAGSSKGPPGNAATGKEKSPEVPKELSVAPHDSKTHGALQVRSVDEKSADWFDVLQDDKRAFAGNPPLLDSTIELLPGSYVVGVNRTQRKVTIEAGKKTILLTGELVVEGQGADWYSPYQGDDRKLVGNPPLLNRPTALFAGTYTVFVRVGAMSKELGEAAVIAGRKTVLKHP